MKISIYRIKSMKISITSKHEIKWREKYILQLNSSWFSNVTQYNVSPLSLKKNLKRKPPRESFSLSPSPPTLLPISLHLLKINSKEPHVEASWKFCRVCFPMSYPLVNLPPKPPTCFSFPKSPIMQTCSPQQQSSHVEKTKRNPISINIQGLKQISNANRLN